MSSRRAHSNSTMVEKPQRGRCVSAICFSWKVLTCIVSHVTLISLVVSYCIGGALLFEYLEKPHELEVKKGIKRIRANVTDDIWHLTDSTDYLDEDIWVRNVTYRLEEFEKNILRQIKEEGWDGDENETQSQWTFFGALFYSIIVITTIGYGHIAPRTDMGKVSTIFYAILGIPLMLLCLSNIGDIMATSFRFIYWRICCFACTRESKKSRRSRQRSMRSSRHRQSRSQPPASFRKSMRHSTRQREPDPGLHHAYSDPELRYQDKRNPYDQPDEFYTNPTQNTNRRSLSRNHRFSRSQYIKRSPKERENFGTARDRNMSKSHQQFNRYDDEFMNRDVERGQHYRGSRAPSVQRIPNHHYNSNSNTLPINRRKGSMTKSRAKSLDKRAAGLSLANFEINENQVKKTPIICNRYAVENMDEKELKKRSRCQSMPRPHRSHSMVPNYNNQRRSSLPKHPQKYSNHLEPPDFNFNPNEVRRARTPQPRDMERERTPRSRGRTPQPREYEDDCEDDDYERYGRPNDDDMRYSRNHDDVHYRRPDDDLDMRYRKEEDEEDMRYNRGMNMHRGSKDSKNSQKKRRRNGSAYPPSPRIMSPMGFAVHRQTRPRHYSDDDSYINEFDSYGDLSPKDRPVPIWLCVFLVVSYIIAGAFLFSKWEKWTFLDSAYFCFITLTTIGFGDFVPAKGVKDDNKESIAMCSLYLLFGIALLAMSFNLVQEEFIANVKEVARRLGIIKDEEDDDED